MPEEPMNGKGATCAIVGVWEVLGRRWSLHILKNLSTKEVIRFNELKRSLAGISSTVLSDVALDVVQREYSADMSVEQAVALSNKAIEKALGERPVVEVGVVSAQEKQFQKLH